MRTRATRLDSAFVSLAETGNEDDGSKDDDDVNVDEVRAPINADVEFGNELGYGLVVALRGRTTGRRLKRNVFCLGLIQLVIGVIVIILTDQAARTFEITEFLNHSRYGTRLLSLWWLSSIIGLILSMPHFFLTYYWASLTTNRLLLITTIRIVMLVQLVNWIFVLATVVTTFRAFGEKHSFVGSDTDQKLLAYYLTSIFFLFPYLLCICNYTMDLSYLNDEIDFGGTVAEKDAPSDTWDLTGLSLEELCRQMIAYPIALMYQTLELMVAVYNLLLRLWVRFLRYLDDRALAHEQELARARLEKKKRKSFLTRLIKTIQRCCAELVKRATSTRDRSDREKTKSDVALMEEALQAEQLLRAFADEKGKEDAERLERERAALEAERAYLRDKEERKRREEAEAQAERDRLEREEALRRKQEEEASSPTLSVASFKELWSQLPVAGQFQCKLKEFASLMTFTEHLRSKGFHIVFAATPALNELEVGVCNIRNGPEEPRFLARFLSSQLAFSAVMKSEKVEAVPEFVKKFALAKVLKIDTSKH